MISSIINQASCFSLAVILKLLIDSFFSTLATPLLAILNSKIVS